LVYKNLFYRLINIEYGTNRSNRNKEASEFTHFGKHLFKHESYFHFLEVIMKQFTKLDLNGMQFTLQTEEWNKIPKNNFETIVEYDKANKRLNLRDATRENNIRVLMPLAKYFQKPYKQITNKDLLGYIDALDVSKGSKSTYIVQIRKFFKWLYQDENPQVIKGLVAPKSKTVKKKFSDMLTEDEIQKLVDSYPDPQHKALVAVLYDSACRVGELVGLKRRDVVCNNGLWTISVDGKTGVRNIPLTLSTIYLEPWFNRYHPSKNDDAPLFISMCHRGLNKKMDERKLLITGIWQILKRGKKASDIKKKVHPHILRHSRLTWLSDHGMSENMMRIYAGWSNGSTMPAVYLHTNPQDVVKKINEIQGGEQASKPEPSKLVPRECPRCKTLNDLSSEYCSKCWLPLNVQVSMAETLLVDLFRSSLYKEESQVAKQEGTYLDLEHLAGKLQEWKAESANPRRKQVQVVKNLI